jgi:xylan 1,4-beta-xylosidase
LLIALFFFPSTAELRKSTRPASFPVHIQIDMTKTRGAVRPVSRFFGADEPNYAYMKNGRKLIAELGQLAPTRVYFRTHNLLSSGDGTPALKWGSTGVYSENANGKPIYDWTILDRIFDTYLKNGVRPYVETRTIPTQVDINGEVRRDLHRLGVPTKRLFEMGCVSSCVGEALRSAIRAKRSRAVVLGSLERSKHSLLARDT